MDKVILAMFVISIVLAGVSLATFVAFLIGPAARLLYLREKNSQRSLMN
jgi:hypothetical protein